MLKFVICVGEGCYLWPAIFNFYTEDILHNILKDKEGMSIGGRKINAYQIFRILVDDI